MKCKCNKKAKIKCINKKCRVCCSDINCNAHRNTIPMAKEIEPDFQTSLDEFYNNNTHDEDRTEYDGREENYQNLKKNILKSTPISHALLDYIIMKYIGEIYRCSKCGKIDDMLDEIYKCDQCDKLFCDDCDPYNREKISRCEIQNCYFCMYGYCYNNLYGDYLCSECYIPDSDDEEEIDYCNYILGPKNMISLGRAVNLASGGLH